MHSATRKGIIYNKYSIAFPLIPCIDSKLVTIINETKFPAKRYTIISIPMIKSKIQFIKYPNILLMETKYPLASRIKVNSTRPTNISIGFLYIYVTCKNRTRKNIYLKNCAIRNSFFIKRTYLASSFSCSILLLHISNYLINFFLAKLTK